MKPTLIAIVQVVALLAFGVPLAFGAEPALEGTYTATGFDLDGSEYRRVVKIVPRGESYLVAWILPEKVGDVIRLVPKSAGVGIVRGGMLAVSFYGQDVTGVILYQIEDGGARLVGRWVAAEGDGIVRTETLIRMPGILPDAPDTGVTSTTKPSVV